MKDLHSWISKQARAERRIVHLEDALLTGSFARYFAHRLRFLVVRTAVSTLIHALKIVLLLGAFPRSQFLVIVIAQAVGALIGDFWWGALERLRAQIRFLQRRGMRHLVPREIARWLSLTVPAALIVPLLAGIYGADQLLTGHLDPVEMYLCVLAAAVALDLVIRTYHSGAYALRRVYRPLPSLLVVDVVSVAMLLALWPLLGLWAYPAAELVSVIVVVSISIRYTTRTYRSLALPTLLPLIRQRRRVPSIETLRASLAPGIAYGLVGLEALVVVAGLAAGTTQAGTTLVVLLAALSPVSRASFEWARLLYFDLKRLELPLLAGLRRKFDRQMVWLAVVIGLVAAGLACAVAAVMLDRPSALLLAGLLALFVVRSILAAAQMQAFTRTVYPRLAFAGVVGVVGLVLVFNVVTQGDARLLGASLALAASLAVLLILPPPTDPGDLVLAPGDWLRAMREQRGPVWLARLKLDPNLAARTATPETRRAEEWRRDEVAGRIAQRIRRRAGVAARVGAHELWLLMPADRRAIDQSALVRQGAGLVRAAETSVYDDPSAAARDLADAALRAWADDGLPARSTPAQRSNSGLTAVPGLLSDFAARFPSAIAYDTTGRVPATLANMQSDMRVEIYRSALRFARDMRGGGESDEWDVTALIDEGLLRAVFAVARSEDLSTRRAWLRRIRAWNMRRAGGAPLLIVPGPVGAVVAEVGVSHGGAAML